MKKILIIISLFLLGCGEGLTASGDSSDTVALVWMYKYSPDYSNNFPCDSVNRLSFVMPIMGSSIPTVESITINQISLEEVTDYDYDYDDNIDTTAACQSGWGHFYQDLEHGHTMVSSNTYSINSFDQINLDINTNQSFLTGTINAPGNLIDSLISYTFSADSSSIIFNWNDANADFYEIDISYECQNEDYDYKGYEYYITSNTYEHEFTCDLDLTEPWDHYLHIRVAPVNGPLPEQGAISNMSGGNGYLYYSSYSYTIYPGYYYSSNSNQKDYLIQGSERSRSKVLEILNLD